MRTIQGVLHTRSEVCEDVTGTRRVCNGHVGKRAGEKYGMNGKGVQKGWDV